MGLPDITNTLSGRLWLGVNTYRDIRAADTTELKGHIHQELAEILEHHRRQLPPGFDMSRKLYRQFRIDPTKHRPSSEALWRRLNQKDDFPDVNPFVNLTNLLSLRFQICFGLYDLDKIDGNITVGLGREGDGFQGIRKDVVNMNGKIILTDSRGAFGNPSSDSLRTCVTPATTGILQILFFTADDPDAADITRRSFQRFRQYFPMADSRSWLMGPDPESA